MWAAEDPETLVKAAADRLGVDLGKPTKSRRHGYRPCAREHVRRYLAVEVLGYRVALIAEVECLHRSTVYESIRVGRELVGRNARTLGLGLDLGTRQAEP